MTMTQRRCFLELTGLVILLLVLAGLAGAQIEEPVLTSDTNYESVVTTVSPEEIAQTVRQLAAVESRVTGYAGCERAARIVEDRFRELGLEDVAIEEFPVLVPWVKVDERGWAASLDAGSGREWEILPIWPNLVRCPKTPAKGITGKLIYAGNGELRAFTGLEVTDSVVLLDFNCGGRWFNAPLLGARVVLFVEPDTTLRGEAEEKFLSMPVDIPRFWVPKEAADSLLAMLTANPEIQVTVKCDMEWRKVVAQNITGRIKGSDPELSKQQVVIQSYYDGISITPTQAPGAENAVSIAALFQVIKSFKQHPPKRTIVFLATAGHFEGLAGSKAFIRKRVRGARSDAHVKRMFDIVSEARADIESVTRRLWTEPAGQYRLERKPRPLDEQLRGLGALLAKVNDAAKKARLLGRVVGYAKRTDPNAGKLVEYQLTEEEMTERQRLTEKFGGRVAEIEEEAAQTKAAIAAARRLGRNADAGQKTAALAKVKEALNALTGALDFSEEDIYLWFSIDLSSHNDAFGMFYKAYYYNYSETDQWKFSDVGKKAREYSQIIGRALSVTPEARFVDGINAIKGKEWHTYMAGQLALSSEVATLAGIPGLGLATIDDSRPIVDTPLDLPDQVDIGNVVEQTRFMNCLLADMISIEEPDDLYELKLTDNFVEVKGRLVEFDPQVATFPDKSVPGAIALARPRRKTAMGVRGQAFDIAGEKDARYSLIGLPNVRAIGGEVTIEGYKLDDDNEQSGYRGTGVIRMAPDQGVNGAKQYPITFALNQPIKPATVVLFHCKPMAIYDMIDQRFFELLSEIYVYDTGTDAPPTEYGYALPLPAQELTSTYEPVAVVFAQPGMRIKVTMAASLLGLQFVLIGSTDDEPTGIGYLADENPSLYATPYRVALDMWRLDDYRINRLTKHGIENDRVKAAHKRAKEQLALAATHLRAREYDKFFTYARSAWSNESSAYPQVRATENDVIKGVIFYLALLLPFAFFTERLVLGATNITGQIFGNVGIFLIVFTVIAFVHPAFAITFTPAIILLAFIILALTVVVVGIIVQKFEEQMKAVRYEQTGIHSADVGRLGASAAAFNLGISNMRRRKTRTYLTAATLVLLTFTVLSFTSVVQQTRTNKLLLPRFAEYDGIMIRDLGWLPIGEATERILKNEFGDRYPVAARGWYFSGAAGQQSFVTIRRGDASYNATAMVGLTPSEADITGIDSALLPGGRWFEAGEKDVCILPESVASTLEVSSEQVGTATVSIFGKQMRVIGIIRSGQFSSTTDLDGEVLTPVDFMVTQQQFGEQMEEQRTVTRRPSKAEQRREYIHLAPDMMVVVPYSFLLNVGGTLRSVAIGIDDPDKVDETLDDLVQRIDLNIYGGVKGRTYLCSSFGTTGFQGMADLVIPILIAAAIVLNTMLGSVYERVREIYIYSSLGLAPTHVAALFVAEASVYAILGAIIGYLIGQVAARILVRTEVVPGLNLNYSSLSAVLSTLIIMATVLASVIYPARRASDIAMPGIERRWAMPEPEGDKMIIKLPFTVTGDQALGVNMYLHEYFAAHTDYSLGQFSTDDIYLTEEDYEYGPGYALNTMVWLAPYDLGVSEQLTIETLPTEDEEIFEIDAQIIRASGDDASWLRVTRNFINILRKQYLLWRTFPVSQKEEYGKRAEELIAAGSPSSGAQVEA